MRVTLAQSSRPQERRPYSPPHKRCPLLPAVPTHTFLTSWPPALSLSIPLPKTLNATHHHKRLKHLNAFEPPDSGFSLVTLIKPGFSLIEDQVKAPISFWIHIRQILKNDCVAFIFIITEKNHERRSCFSLNTRFKILSPP